MKTSQTKEADQSATAESYYLEIEAILRKMKLKKSLNFS